MKFDSAKGDTGIVYDRFGDWVERPIRGDTYTGDVECFVMDTEGSFILDNGECKKEWRRYAAPLTITPLPPNFKSSDLDSTRRAKPL